MSGNGNGVLAEIKARLLERGLRHQHSVAGFLGAAGFGNDDAKGFIQIGADGGQNPVHAVRVGVVEEKGLELVGARIAQGVGDKLRPQRRPADANQQIIFKRSARAANFARVNFGRKILDSGDGFFDFLANFRRWRERRDSAANNGPPCGFHPDWQWPRLQAPPCRRTPFAFAVPSQRRTRRPRSSGSNPPPDRVRETRCNTFENGPTIAILCNS